MNDVELESWRRQWQTAAVAPGDLKERVTRETRTVRRRKITEVAAGLVLGGVSIMWARLSLRPDALVLALGVCVSGVAALTTSFLLRWPPVTLSTAAFLDLSILRCTRRHGALAAQSILYVLVLAFDLAWIYFLEEKPDPLDVGSFLTSDVIWVSVATAVLGIVAMRRFHRLSRELETLTRLRADTAGATSHSEGEERWKSRVKTARGLRRKKRSGGLSGRN